MKYLLSLILCVATSVSAMAADPVAKPAKKLTILAYGAHMDDAEGGVGGILIQAVKAGHRVVVVEAVSDLTTWKATIGREEQSKADQLALAKRFGWEKRFLGYPYHSLEANNELKRKFAAIYEEVQPDIAFVQNVDDYWPDHAASGKAATDAVLFPHGYTANRDAKRCPRVFAYASGVNQTIRFEADYFADVTPVMGDYMDLINGLEVCLNGRPLAEQIRYEMRDVKTNHMLKLSGHAWHRLCLCADWALQSGTSATYAIGLKTIWGPRDGRPLW